MSRKIILWMLAVVTLSAVSISYTIYDYKREKIKLIIDDLESKKNDNK